MSQRWQVKDADSARLLDHICGHSSQLLALKSEASQVNLVSELASAIGDTHVESHKIAEAISVLDQQRALICGLQSAHLNAVKIAAALTEACKLAQDGAIDVGDVIDHARQALIDGTVKLSSVDELFDQSPGEVVTGTAEVQTAPSGQQQDILTQMLRSLK